MSNVQTKAKSNPYAGVISQIEFITPEAAREILSKNTHNRSIKPNVVKYYQYLMASGQWDVNGESIKIATDGTLLDGQHRLEAISRNDCGIDTFVVRGLPRDSFTTIDAGKTRSHGDYLKIAGYEGNASTLAASSRIAMFFNKDGVFKVSGGGNNGNNKVSPEDIVVYVEKHPGIKESAQKLSNGINKLIPVSIAIGCHYIFSTIDMEKADEFFSRLESGEGLKSGDPILALRNRLISLRGDNRAGEGHRRMLVYYIVHSWNAFMKGRDIKEIKYQSEYEIRIDNFKENILSNWGN